MAPHTASLHAPHAVVMVRPHHYHPNPETVQDNSFQQVTPLRSADRLPLPMRHGRK